MIKISNVYYEAIDQVVVFVGGHALVERNSMIGYNLAKENNQTELETRTYPIDGVPYTTTMEI